MEPGILSNQAQAGMDTEQRDAILAFARENRLSPSDVVEIMKRFEFGGSIQNNKMNGSNMNNFTARVGYNHPVGDGNLNVGISAGGVRGNAGGNPMNMNQIMGGNITYNNGPSSVGLRYDRNYMFPGQDPNTVNPTTLRNVLQLMYSRQF